MARNVDGHVEAERAAVVEIAASTSTAKVENWREVLLGLCICGHALRIVVVGDSTPLAKGYD